MYPTAALDHSLSSQTQQSLAVLHHLLQYMTALCHHPMHNNHQKLTPSILCSSTTTNVNLATKLVQSQNINVNNSDQKARAVFYTDKDLCNTIILLHLLPYALFLRLTLVTEPYALVTQTYRLSFSIEPLFQP